VTDAEMQALLSLAQVRPGEVAWFTHDELQRACRGLVELGFATTVAAPSVLGVSVYLYCLTAEGFEEAARLGYREA
jgi:hypothetical protein